MKYIIKKLLFVFLVAHVVSCSSEYGAVNAGAKFPNLIEFGSNVIECSSVKTNQDNISALIDGKACYGFMPVTLWVAQYQDQFHLFASKEKCEEYIKPCFKVTNIK